MSGDSVTRNTKSIASSTIGAGAKVLKGEKSGSIGSTIGRGLLGASTFGVSEGLGKVFRGSKRKKQEAARAQAEADAQFAAGTKKFRQGIKESMTQATEEGIVRNTKFDLKDDKSSESASLLAGFRQRRSSIQQRRGAPGESQTLLTRKKSKGALLS
jgi:hypothetical protein